jgi:NADPH-dependent curcumin reductase CurA
MPPGPIRLVRSNPPAHLDMTVTAATAGPVKDLREAIALVPRQRTVAVLTSEDKCTFVHRAWVVALAAEYQRVAKPQDLPIVQPTRCAFDKSTPALHSGWRASGGADR